MKAIIVSTLPALFILACASETVSPPGAESPLALAHAGSGDVADVMAFTDFPTPTVVVTQDGLPKAGVTVTWSRATDQKGAADTWGTLSPTTSVTDANGRATTQWKLDRATGLQAIVASLPSTDAPMVVFRANAVKGPPVSLVALRGGDQVALTSMGLQRLDGQALDAAGNSVTNVAVAWTTISGPVSLSQLPGLSATPIWTGGAGTAVVRMQLLDSPLYTDFRLAKVPPFTPFQLRPGPPYLVGIGGTPAAPQFKSHQNWPVFALDTIPVGGTLTFGDLMTTTHSELILVGLPGYPDGLSVPRFGHVDVVFTTPGLYTYYLASGPPPISRAVLVQ